MKAHPGALTSEPEASHPAPGLVVYQPARAYRFGVEVYLLSAFALRGGIPRQAVDLGAGSGVLGLFLARWGARVTLVEREARWAPLLRRSIEESGLSAQVELVEADLRSLDPLPRADLVICNPPWFPADQPRSEDPWRANARSMLHGDVVDFARVGLSIASRLCMVTRPEREGALRQFCRDSGARWTRRCAWGERLLLLELQRGESPVEAKDGPRKHDERSAPTLPVEETLSIEEAYGAAGMSPPRADHGSSAGRRSN